ncbi:MAG: hypothetical protein GX483_03955 [Actinomycetaceae bacterium]|nr:hypothetical protein [Actinomycetaceae bacterium]
MARTPAQKRARTASNNRIILIMTMLTLFLIAGFLVGAWINENSGSSESSDPAASYITHDPASAQPYVAPFVGDQANTFGLMQTLPLTQHTTYLAIVDQGVRVTVSGIDLLADETQYEMLYSAAIVMATIDDVQAVTYVDASYEIVITREFIEQYVPTAHGLPLDSPQWDDVREELPIAADHLEPVSSDGQADPLGNTE